MALDLGKLTQPVASETAARGYASTARPRRLLARTLIALIIVGHVTALYFNLELWPFSPYGMYSDVRDEYAFTQFDLFAVPEGAPDREFVLWGESYFRPLSHYHMRSYLGRLDARGEHAQMQDVLKATLDQYELLREAEGHDGPPIQALRLYRATWSLDVETVPAHQPTHKELIAEVNHETP